MVYQRRLIRTRSSCSARLKSIPVNEDNRHEISLLCDEIKTAVEELKDQESKVYSTDQDY